MSNEKQILASFAEIARAKNWQALHTPKNLAAAVAVEAGELLAEFTWLENDGILDAATKARVSDEIADVYMYLVVLAKTLDIDLDTALNSKMAANRARFLTNTPTDNACE